MESPKRVISKQIGQLLLERGLISKKQLQRALEEQKKENRLLGQILVNLGYIGEEDVVEALTAQYGYPYLPLENYDIDRSVMECVPVQVARHYHLIPIDRIGNILTIVVSDPLNVYAVKDIEQMTKMKVEIFISTTTDIDKSIEKCYGKLLEDQKNKPENRNIDTQDTKPQKET